MWCLLLLRISSVLCLPVALMSLTQDFHVYYRRSHTVHKLSFFNFLLEINKLVFR